MLALQISSFWMESQLFILYTSGDGLMYQPIFNITGNGYNIRDILPVDVKDQPVFVGEILKDCFG